MRLFTSVFYVICTVATLVFLYIMSSNQLEKIEIRYQNTAKNCSVEIDAKLKEIRKLINDISLITWVKKLSSSSEVFLREFDDLQRLECQAELTRYFTTDGAISDIALYMADRGAVLSQRGWFTESERKVRSGSGRRAGSCQGKGKYHGFRGRGVQHRNPEPGANQQSDQCGGTAGQPDPHSEQGGI